MSDITNIPTGLKIQSQIPLNSKEWVQNEATLAYLGIDDNLAFTYHDQMEIFCLEEKTLYIWREVQEDEENTGLIPLDFTYPNNLPKIYNINYSGKNYNFFQNIYITSENIENYVETIEGPVGPPGEPGEPGQNGTDGVSIIENGESTIVSGDGSEEDPYIIEIFNQQKVISVFPHTLTDEDNKYTIFINNDVENVVIEVPDDLIENFACVFVQEGDGTVTFSELDTTELRVPTGFEKQIKGFAWFVVLEKKLNTAVHYLSGNLTETTP